MGGYILFFVKRKRGWVGEGVPLGWVLGNRGVWGAGHAYVCAFTYMHSYVCILMQI